MATTKVPSFLDERNDFLYKRGTVGIDPRKSQTNTHCDTHTQLGPQHLVIALSKAIS